MDDSDTSRTDPTVDRLARVTSAYGADPARWPAEERAALQDLLAGMDAAVDKVDAERALDRLLDMVPPPEPPPGAVDRVLAAAGVAAGGAEVIAFPGTPRSRPVGMRLRPAVGLIAASLVLGIITGTTPVADPLLFGAAGDRTAAGDDLDSALVDFDAEFGMDDEEDPL